MGNQGKVFANFPSTASQVLKELIFPPHDKLTRGGFVARVFRTSQVSETP